METGRIQWPPRLTVPSRVLVPPATDTAEPEPPPRVDTALESTPNREVQELQAQAQTQAQMGEPPSEEHEPAPMHAAEEVRARAEEEGSSVSTEEIAKATPAAPGLEERAPDPKPKGKAVESCTTAADDEFAQAAHEATPTAATNDPVLLAAVERMRAIVSSVCPTLLQDAYRMWNRVPPTGIRVLTAMCLVFNVQPVTKKTGEVCGNDTADAIFGGAGVGPFFTRWATFDLTSMDDIALQTLRTKYLVDEQLEPSKWHELCEYSRK
eukprot:COSAG02_NODE_2655_length_8287_cov_2.497384_3_plen_267_part_00